METIATVLPATKPRLEEVLQQRFGLAGFRPGQREIVETLINGRQTLVIMPTGGGKSLCYQLPALLLDGVTLVVSPLISLMQDQVDALEKRGIAATYINSLLNPQEQAQRIAQLSAGKFKLVYIAPERFRQQSFWRALQQVNIALLAVDEAHCISQWGHDFRPDYLHLGRTIQHLGIRRIGAFTATATPDVRQDICQNLGLQDPALFIMGFARPNLSFRVSHNRRVADKYARLSKLIQEQKTGIIYCSTRKQVEEVAERLQAWSIAFVTYHAGMDDTSRQAAQVAFIAKDCDVVVATNAFGMGIDRADVRFVAHFQLPGSMEAYYQEAGRAGRDGQPAICELLFNYRDKEIQEFFIAGSNPSRTTIVNTYSTLLTQAQGNNEVLMSIDALTGQVDGERNAMAIGAALSFLVRSHYIERFGVPGQRIRGTRLLQPDVHPEALIIDDTSLREKESRDRNKLDAVIQYAYSTSCRQQWILQYFGEANAQACQRCDHCTDSATATPAKQTTTVGLLTRESTPRLPSDRELLIVQKLLSGVARMSYRTKMTAWQARYGQGKIIDVLLGRRSAGIIDAGLDKLSTHGLLRTEKLPYLKTLFHELLEAKLLEKVKREHFELVTLTSAGAQAMRGKIAYKLHWPMARQSKTNGQKPGQAAMPQMALTDDIERLYEALREERNAMAEERGIPAFRILSNRTLKELAIRQPTHLEETDDILGIGPIKQRSVIPPLLEVIRTYETTSAGTALNSDIKTR